MHSIFFLLLLFLVFFRCNIAPKGTTFSDSLSYKSTLPIRGFAAISVVFTHIGIYPCYHHGFLLVALFFFFSGIGLLYSFKNKANYLRGFLPKRFAAILIPWWSATVIYIIYFSLSGISLSPTQILQSFANPLYNVYHVITPSWYLVTSLFFYLLFFFSYKFLNSKWAFLFMSLGFIAYVLIFKHLDSRWTNSCITFIMGFFVMEIPFFKKILLQNNFKSFSPRFFYTLKMLLATLLTIIFYATNYYKFPANWISCIAFVCFVVLFLQKVKIRSKILNFLGKISLEIYMIHFIIIFIISKINSAGNPEWKQNVFSFNIESFYLSTLLVLSLTIILAFALNKLNSFLIKKFTSKFVH